MKRLPKLAILIATGSPVVHRFDPPTGVDYVKLPAVRKVGPEEYEARILATSYERIIAMRSQIMLSLVQTYRPHILLVDHSPTGMKGEMLPALRWLDENHRDCTKVLGLRDIIDDPTEIREQWRQSGVYNVLRELYDQVLIYGTASTYDTATEYDFPGSVRDKTVYCNYVGESSRRSRRLSAERRSRQRPLVVVTIGGGDGAGELVIGNYLDMLQTRRDQIDFDSVIIPGPFLPEPLQSRFAGLAKGLPVTIKGFVNSTTPYFRRADLVVATAGYNSIAQILESASRALIIPRILHRHEQEIRARRLDELGIITMLHPDEVSPETMFDQVRRLLADPRQPIAEARANSLVQLDGAQKVSELFAVIVQNLQLNEVANE